MLSHFCANHHSKEILSKRYSKLLGEHTDGAGAGAGDVLDGPELSFEIHQLHMT